MILPVILVAAAVAFFGLSLTQRHGRSRWPLHALMATGIVAIGLAVIALVPEIALVTAASPEIGGQAGPAPAGNRTASLPNGTGATWTAAAGVLAGLLAGARAVIGMIREPGPRF